MGVQKLMIANSKTMGFLLQLPNPLFIFPYLVKGLGSRWR